MKEQIYTIPVNEAYDTDCECPLCVLERKLEKEGVDYALGAAMMEPDYRVESNAVGYCRHHYRLMFAVPNNLSLALVLDTHLEEIRKNMNKHEKAVTSQSKGGLFKKNTAAAELADSLSQVENGCMICKKIDYTMDRYMDVVIYLWNNDPNFREKFERSKGLCLPHFRRLADMCGRTRGSEEFLAALFKKEKAELDRIQADIHKFTLKFDYRNQNMEWGTAQDAPIRTIEKIAQYITEEE